MANGYRSCDESLCPINGGIIGPGEEAVHTEHGTYHTQCLPASERSGYASALAQQVVAESRACRAALARKIAAEDARLAAVMSRRAASSAPSPAG